MPCGVLIDYERMTADPLRALPLRIASLARQEIQPTSEDLEALKAYLDLRLLSHAGSDPSSSLQRSQEPGYLYTLVGGHNLFVPFHLAPYFPSKGILQAAVEVATSVRLNVSNPICISGSTTFLGALREVGDLDFCEYYLSASDGLPNAVSSKSRNTPPTLVEVKCGDTKHHFPWDNLTTDLNTNVIIATGDTPANAIKMDFLSSSSIGVLPTTSIVLPLGDDRESGNAMRSFTYQEAVLTRDTPPRSLVRPESLGRYLEWLIEDARTRLVDGAVGPTETRGTKALKRLLSAMLLLGEAEEAQSILDGINQPALQAVVVRGRRLELETLISYIPASERGPFVAHIEASTPLNFSDTQIAQAAELALEIGREAPVKRQ